MKAFEIAASEIRGEQKVSETLEILAAYCTGWSKANAQLVRSVVADCYVWNDPDEGRITRKDLQRFLARFRSKIDVLRTGLAFTDYLTFSGLVVDGSRSPTTAWCNFAVPGTEIEGMSQIQVGHDGVMSERRAYRTRPLVRVAGVRSRG